MPRMATLALLLVSALFPASGCAWRGLLQRPERPLKATPEPRVGKPAPEFDGEDFEGRRVKLSDYRGKVVVLVFWSTRCPPCRAMIPHEREMVERFHDRPFALIGVNNDTE